MQYTVEAKGAELSIKVEDVGDQQDELLQSLQECAKGRCSCPTTQYEKVDAIAIESGTDTVRIALKAKPGEVIDETAIDSVWSTRLARPRMASGTGLLQRRTLLPFF